MVFIIAEAEASEQAAAVDGEEASMISLLDIFIITTLLGLAMYYLFWRKEEEKITIKRLDVSWVTIIIIIINLSLIILLVLNSKFWDSIM